MLLSYLLVPSHNTFFFFFFNDTATTEIYTLSLHDALPICVRSAEPSRSPAMRCRTRPKHGTDELAVGEGGRGSSTTDRKSTRLNSSHSQISYAVFCLKKKKQIIAHSSED